jgi:hypothetical protein
MKKLGGPDDKICGKHREEERQRFLEELEKISNRVEDWPEWKKEGWAVLDLEES